MKKLIGIGLVLAMMAMVLSVGIVSADGPQGVHTEWSFSGPGELNIHTEMSSGSGDYTVGAVSGEDHLNIDSYGSGTSGYQNISSYHAGYYDWKGFSIERYVEVENGSVDTWTVRDNVGSGWYWPAYTEYGALLDTDGAGSLFQSFSNVYSVANMETAIQADCSYLMGAGLEGTIGGYFNFGIGAEGDSSGELYLSTTDRSEHNGYRLLMGNFCLDADPADAGFSAIWGNLADFSGYVETPNIYQEFNVDVGGSGDFNEGASASWVIIQGFIDEMK